MTLRIRTQERSIGVFEIALEGRLDSVAFSQLDRTLETIFSSRPKVIRLNMSKLDYISSMGLGSVVLAIKKSHEIGCRFAMVELKPGVKKVFEIAALLPEQSVFASVEEADSYYDMIQRKQPDDTP